MWRIWREPGVRGVNVLVVVADRGEQFGDVVVEEAVVRVATSSLDSHETSLAQDAQLLGGGARSEARGFDQLLDRAFGAQHGPQQEQTA